MAHPQSTPRGVSADKRQDVGLQQLTDGTTYLKLNLGLALSAQTTAITQDANRVAFPKGVQPGLLTTKPSTRYGPGSVVMVGNSTGNLLAINTTGTTWAYLNTTAVLA